jgi:DNA recombination protein RmuC
MEITYLLLLFLLLLVLLGGALAAFAVYSIMRLNARVDTLSQTLPDQSSFKSLTDRLKEVDDSSRASFERLSSTLGGLEKATQQMMDVGKTIGSLEDLLRPPKLRGGMGETLLAELLGQILPSAAFQLQYRFSTGATVDAVIHLGRALVPVDAKFPLESFRRLIAIEDPGEAQKERRVFNRALKGHIDQIATKYILPDEGTYDFALMYIPAENIYYETVLKDDSEEAPFPYALSRRVIPVSPNSFYAYLQVIIHGLKGLQIEERAKEIMGHLNRLRGDEERFRTEFETLGKHLENARNKYEDAQRKLVRFEEKLLAASEGATQQPTLEDKA